MLLLKGAGNERVRCETATARRGLRLDGPKVGGWEGRTVGRSGSGARSVPDRWGAGGGELCRIDGARGGRDLCRIDRHGGPRNPSRIDGAAAARDLCPCKDAADSARIDATFAGFDSFNR